MFLNTDRECSLWKTLCIKKVSSCAQFCILFQHRVFVQVWILTASEQVRSLKFAVILQKKGKLFFFSI